ncbi:MAG TPA: secretin [Limnochordia bacterium]|nr:secretin [Limnochordia bacterium]
MSKRSCVVLVLVLMLVFGGVAGAENVQEQPLVNLFLFETGIRDALSEITIQTGINIIPDSTVSGRVTADLQDVPLEQALRLILIGGGFSFRKIDDFYFVGLPDPRSTTFRELAETQVVSLKNVTAGQVISAMPSFLTSYVKGERDSKMLTITAPPSELDRILEFIQTVDVKAKQVEIQVIVTEVSTKALKELGTNLFEFSMGAGERFKSDWSASLGLENNVLSFGTNLFGTLLMNLKALEEAQEASIHADPRVLVSDGQPAELFVGDRQIILLADSNDRASRVERIEVGMHLKVTPQIMGDEIVLSIAPEMSHFVSESKSNLVVKQSSVSTTIRLQDGQTAVLAGMTLQEEGDQSRKVPILGDIPIIRWLFRSDTTRASEKELLIFVTPVIK